MSYNKPFGRFRRRLRCWFGRAGAMAAGCASLIAWARADGQPAQQAITIFVAPGGSDLFTGIPARPNLQRTDGPVATLAHARDLIRLMRRNNGGKLDHPVDVMLRAGTYWLAQPFELTAEDSGTPECPITYMAYRDEQPVVSASRPVRQWGKATLNGHDVWAAKVPSLKDADTTLEELWVDGHLRHMARLPKKGFFLAGEVPKLTKKTPQQQGQTSFHYKGEDLKNWPDASDATVVLMSLWTDSHLPVASIDQKQHLISFTKATVLKMAPDDRYYIEGAAEMLAEPGEWYLDRKTATLYYYPMPGETMIGTQVVMPVHDHAVQLVGAPDQGQFVEHVAFRGITFANSEWDIPRKDAHIRNMKPAGFDQAEWGVPGVIMARGVHHCTFENCTVTRAGNYGIELAGGCQDNRISYCTLTDLGAGGIKIGEPRVQTVDALQTSGNEIADCTIADCGNLYPSAIGIWLGQTPGNRIVHNEIHGLWYTGISIGWTWGYGNSLPHDNIVEFNHVHHIGSPADGVEPILSDMGAIYTLGKQPGTIIRNNRFHDIAGLRYGGWGIYFDEGTSDVLAENNLVYRTTHGGFHQHYGENNVVRNNIFAFGRDAQIRRSRAEEHLSFTFERNLVYWDKGMLLDGNWSKLNVKFDHNTYWHVGGDEDFKFANMTWAEWRKAGMDEHGQIKDPGFTDPLHADFHLKEGAARDLGGFVPFDVSSAGPRSKEPAD